MKSVQLLRAGTKCRMDGAQRYPSTVAVLADDYSSIEAQF